MIFKSYIIIANKKSYAEQISNAQVMLAGLKNNAAEVAKRGITPEFIETLDTNLQTAIDQNNTQEKLKSDLKAATAALDATLVSISDEMSESTKVVKLAMPKEQWKEFGITATR